MSYPNHIRVSGLPFMLQGWNNIYVKTDRLSEGAPVYELAPYTLYGCIPIIGTRIFKTDGKWRLQRMCDFEPVFTNLSEVTSTPLGAWFETYNERLCTITDADNERDSVPLAILVLTIAIGLGLLFKMYR